MKNSPVTNSPVLSTRTTTQAVSIPCYDGCSLHNTLHQPGVRPKDMFLLNPASAVPERLYCAFASHLAEQAGSP